MPTFKDYIAGRTAETSIVDADEFYVRDDSGDTDKRITYGGLKTALDGVYETVNTAGPRTALYLPGTSGNYVSTPDFAFGAADLDLIALIDPADWTPAAQFDIVSKFNSSTALLWSINTNGTMFLRIVTAAVANRDALSSVAVGGVDGTPLWVRATFDSDNGASGTTVRFYKATYDGSLTIPTSWTQVGIDVTIATAVTMRDTSDAVEIGSRTGGTAALFTGEIHRVVIRDTIDGAAVADYRADAPASRYRDSAGRLWTVNGTGSAWLFPT